MSKVNLKNSNDLILFLKKLGYHDLKLNQEGEKLTSVGILTDEKNRMMILDKLYSLISNSERKYETTKSSIGHLEVILPNKKKISVVIKPKKKQGKGSAGLDNEHFFVQKMKEFLSPSNPMNVIFVAQGKKKIYKNIVGVDLVSSHTVGKLKADVHLIQSTGNKIPISIKKDNADHWESSDTFFEIKKKAKELLDSLIEEGILELKNMGSFYKLTGKIKSFAFKPTREQKVNLVFGSDILKENGLVVIRTFRDSDFQSDQKNLKITVSDYLDSVSDIKGPNDVYMLVRNDSTRRMKDFPPGLRILAVKPRRINQEVLVVR